LPKPAFNAFKLLHKLGDRRIAVDSKSALATRTSTGASEIAVWNLFLPEETGQPKDVALEVKGVNLNRPVLLWRVDSTHGSLLNAYVAMGSPVSPTEAQAEKLRQAAELPPPQKLRLHNGKLNFSLPAQGLALLEIR
jgi:xylan 1,4-beta-xylosidase